MRRFCPRFRLVTLAEKQAFKIYFTTSSEILFRTNFKLRSLFVFYIYSQRASTFWSPSSAPPKSMTSHLSLFRSSKTCLYFSGISIFLRFLFSTGPRTSRFVFKLKSAIDLCRLLLLLCNFSFFYLSYLGLSSSI